MSCSQFLAFNYADESVIAELTASSAAIGFPVSNLVGSTRRTKVWRSGGYFNIEAGKNLIVFEETAATPLTATVVADEYESFDDLAAAIKTALEAVGSSTYTVTQDPVTLKAFIESDGTGGGGIFNILWTFEPDLGQTLGFDTTSNDTGSLEYLADSLRISTGEFFLFDFGMGLNPDAIVVSWRQDELNTLLETAILNVKANHTNNFATVIYEENTAKTDYGFLIRKQNATDQGIAPSPLRFWKLTIEDLDNTTGFIELGSIFIGDFIGFTRGAIQFPFSASWDDGTLKTQTDGGQVFNQQRYMTRTFTAEFFALTKEEKAAFDEFFYEVRTGKPFYFLVDPNQVIETSVEKSLYYCRFASTPSWKLERPGVFSLSCQLREDI
jgi:hypothetical protein